MDDDLEKKISIDELPDEGNSSMPPARKIRSKNIADPRLERISILEHDKKIEVMGETWSFDKRDWKFGWLAYVIILITLEKNNFYQRFLLEVDMFNKLSMDIAGVMVETLPDIFHLLMKHPSLFILLTPFLFKLRDKSDHYFEINFDGISCIKSVLTRDSKELVARCFIKWKDITEIKEVKVGERAVLRLLSLEGKMGELIWDISLDQKRALKLLLAGMIQIKHPLRIYLDNEKELK